MQKIYKDLVKAGTIVSAVLVANAIQAADKELLDILLSNSSITQEQYDGLLAKEALTVEDAEDIVVSFGGGSGLNVSADNGDWEVGIGGRLHLEYAQHEHDSGLGALPVNGSTIRRARLEMDGTIWGKWGWAAEFDWAERNILKAKKQEKKGKLDKAKKFYKKALVNLEKANKADPANPDILNYLGFTERKLGNYKESEIYYLVGLELDPEHFGINEYLGELYVTTNRIDLAKERLKVLEKCNCEQYNELNAVIKGTKKSKY